MRWVATSPAGPRVQRRLFIDDDEREAQAVCDRIPAIVEGKIMDGLARRTASARPLTRVVELAGEFASDAIGGAGIARGKGREIPDDQARVRRGEAGHPAGSGEGEPDAAW